MPFDFVVCVKAPDEVRLARIMERDAISEAKAREWIGCQMPQDEVAARADFVINNDGKADVGKQTELLLHLLGIQRMNTINY